jgi:hypothetical protein
MAAVLFKEGRFAIAREINRRRGDRSLISRIVAAGAIHLPLFDLHCGNENKRRCRGGCLHPQKELACGWDSRHYSELRNGMSRRQIKISTPVRVPGKKYTERSPACSTPRLLEN